MSFVVDALAIIGAVNVVRWLIVALDNAANIISRDRKLRRDAAKLKWKDRL